MAVESSNKSVEAEQQQENAEEEVQEVEEYQPLYRNSYDLCADVLADIEALGYKAHNARNLWDMALLWYDLEVGTTLMLTKIKLELLQHFLEIGK